MEFKLGELFCGPGGMSLGALMAEFDDGTEIHKIVHEWASDYDEDSCKTYSRNICKTDEIADSVHHKDVKVLDISSLPPIDILAFGFPCNDFSHVGESKGMEGNYGMLYKFGVMALDEYNPIAFVAENVSGINSSNEGKAFAQILKELRNAAKHGYNITTELHAFEHLGVPQARHRYIIVGIRKDLNKKYHMHAHTHLDSDDMVTAIQALENPPHHLVEFGISGEIPDGFPDHRIREPDGVVKRRLDAIPEGENAWCDAVESDPELRINTKTKLSSIYRRLHRKKPAYTVTGSGGGGTHMYHWEISRALTNREKARLQTFPDDYRFEGGVTSVRKQIGMAVPPYGAKLIFETLLATLTDAPSLELISDVDPKKATFWQHPIRWINGENNFFHCDSVLQNIQNGRVLIILPSLAPNEIQTFQQFIRSLTSKGVDISCIINNAWKDGLESTVLDTLLMMQNNMELFSVKSSFVKGNSSVAIIQNEDCEVESIYSSIKQSETKTHFLEMRKISLNEILVKHINHLFSEDQYSKLPQLLNISTRYEMQEKIRSDIEKFNKLDEHSSAGPTDLNTIAESIDLLEIARKSPVSSFNLEFGRGRRRDGSAGPRRWTEIELTIGNRYSNLPNRFEAHTHDGKVLPLKRSGGNADLGKDLASAENRHLFGVWMKGCLYSSGALKEGERITEATFEEYGKTTLDFYKIDEDVFFLDFAPKAIKS